MRFAVHYNHRTYSYYVLDNEDGAVISCRLDYDKACILAHHLNEEQRKDVQVA